MGATEEEEAKAEEATEEKEEEEDDTSTLLHSAAHAWLAAGAVERPAAEPNARSSEILPPRTPADNIDIAAYYISQTVVDLGVER